MEETFAYLKDVLGIKYLPLSHATVTDGESALFVSDDPEQIALHTSGLDSDIPVGRAASMDLSEPEEFIDEAAKRANDINVEAVSASETLENISELRRQSDDLIEQNEMDSAPVADTIQANPLTHQSPVVSDQVFTASLAQNIAALESGISGCQRCKLHKDRKSIVFGAGSAKAKIMFIGEGPGESDDDRGEPFVGAAGDLLNKMIAAMGLKREEVYLTNVIKCRPPQGRSAAPDEKHECSPFLQAQIRLINPKIIVALGTEAAQMLLQSDRRMAALRGEIQLMAGGRKMIATYHPAYLLKNPDEKKAAWQDLKLAMKELKN